VEYDVNMTVNGQSAGPVQQVTFSSTGAVATPAGGVLNFNGFAPTNGALPMALAFNFGATTQFGGQFGVTSITQNGYATGQLSTVAIDPTGIVSAVYTNGRSTQLGQLAMANFPNPQGLKALGDTSRCQRILKTHYGHGYRFVCSAVPPPRSPTAPTGSPSSIGSASSARAPCCSIH